jgi:hypothetical protein
MKEDEGEGEPTSCSMRETPAEARICSAGDKQAHPLTVSVYEATVRPMLVRLTSR